MDIETPTEALFARFTALPEISYLTRTLEPWDSVAPPQTPALMLVSGSVVELPTANGVQGMTPQLWRVQLLAVLYVRCPDKRTPAGTPLNLVIASVVNALLQQGGEVPHALARFVANPIGQRVTTLGGLCVYCRPFGTIERAEGVLDQVSVAHIPIEMVLTS